MSTYNLRLKLIEIARLDKDKIESSRNQGSWIKKLWSATNYPEGYDERQPYCAAGVCYCIREWLKIPEVLDAFGFSATQAEKWRPKYSSVFKSPKNNLLYWAEQKGLEILDKNANFHTGDLIIYEYSHVEFYTGDDVQKGIFCIGYNTNASGSRDGEGCFEKRRTRNQIKCAIRMLP